MNKLLITTAIAGLFALPLAAQNATDAPATPPAAPSVTAPADTGAAAQTTAPTMGGETVASAGIDPTTIEGMRVYDSEMKDIGEVDKLATSSDGSFEAIVDVGGFLGIGEKPVALTLDQLSLVREEGAAPDDFKLQVAMTKDQLEALPPADEDSADAGAQMPADQTATDQATADATAPTGNQVMPMAGADNSASADASDMSAPKDQGTMAANDATNDATAPTAAPAANPDMSATATPEASTTAKTMDTASGDTAVEGSQTVATAGIDADTLAGANVYDANDEHIGEINHVVTDASGQQMAIIDVGGFLGFGEKPVAVSLEQMTVSAEPAAGSDAKLDLHVSLTKEQLEAMPEYKS